MDYFCPSIPFFMEVGKRMQKYKKFNTKTNIDKKFIFL